MGGDGGTIPTREDLVRHQRRRGVASDPFTAAAARLAHCALTAQPLQRPIVACARGLLYNKTAVIEHLLAKSDAPAFRHIRGLKDLLPLTVTFEGENTTCNSSTATAVAPRGGGDDDSARADGLPPRLVCPLSGAVASGRVPFVACRPCGCVLSLRALLELSDTNPDTGASAGAGGAGTRGAHGHGHGHGWVAAALASCLAGTITTTTTTITSSSNNSDASSSNSSSSSSASAGARSDAGVVVAMPVVPPAALLISVCPVCSQSLTVSSDRASDEPAFLLLAPAGEGAGDALRRWEGDRRAREEKAKRDKKEKKRSKPDAEATKADDATAESATAAATVTPADKTKEAKAGVAVTEGDSDDKGDGEQQVKRPCP